MFKFRKARKLRIEGQEIIEPKIGLKEVTLKTQPDVIKDSHTKCNSCNEIINIEKSAKELYSCTKCHYLFRINPLKRIEITFDNFKELFINEKQPNPLGIKTYEEKLIKTQKSTGFKSAVTVGVAKIFDEKCVTFIMNPDFVMASMGVVVGSKITKAFNYAAKHKLPVVGFIASGGARMQEAMYALMQMAKTSAAVGQFDKKGGLYIPVLTSPTYGGVSASFAMLGDIIIAEENAMIGFAGKKVIKDAMKQDLPKGFQTAEFLLEKGFVDLVSSRKNMKENIYNLLSFHNKKRGYK